MAHELIYTSAERGLRPGTRGFCTVAYTQGMQPQVMQILEALSAYKSLYAVHEEAMEASPVAWSHYRGNLLGRSASVLSRVCPTKADHTNRSNKLAHHILIQQRERPAGGPAWLSSQLGLFREEWTELPHVIGTPKVLPEGDEQDCKALTWETLTGDAGYAGMLASSFHTNPDQHTILVFKPGMNMLALIREALRLLPVAERWNVTYNTYFTSLPAGAVCCWRCYVADSDELREVRRNPRGQIVDLTQTLPPLKQDDIFVRMARGEQIAMSGAVAETSEETPHRKFTLMPQRHEINQLSLKPRAR